MWRIAIIASGMSRATTGDVDILLDTALDNETRVFKALEILPDKAVLALDPGDVSKYAVVRVADEIIVDLMKAACGVEYNDAAAEINILNIEGTYSIRFRSRLVWRMKAPTHREKDAPRPPISAVTISGNGAEEPPPSSVSPRCQPPA